MIGEESLPAAGLLTPTQPARREGQADPQVGAAAAQGELVDEKRAQGAAPRLEVLVVPREMLTRVAAVGPHHPQQERRQLRLGGGELGEDLARPGGRRGEGDRPRELRAASS